MTSLLVNWLSVGIMGKEYLTKPGQYALVYNNGSSWVSSLVVMKALPNGLSLSRYGLSVGKRVGKAVTRNRVKRRLREILRLTLLKPGWDIIFIARPAAANADYASLEKSVEGLLSRAQLLIPVEKHGLSTEVKVRDGGGSFAEIYPQKIVDSPRWQKAHTF